MLVQPVEAGGYGHRMQDVKRYTMYQVQMFTSQVKTLRRRMVFGKSGKQIAAERAKNHRQALEYTRREMRRLRLEMTGSADVGAAFPSSTE